MTLLQELGQEFPRTVRQKGDAYYRKGAVRLTKTTPTLIEARVQGTFIYDVTIRGPEGAVECTCEYFREHGDPCKHIWATMLAADAKDKLAPELFEGSDDAEETDEEESQEWGSEGRSISQIKAARARTVAAPTEPVRHAVWRRRLAELRAEAQWSENAVAASWPVDRPIYYIVDVAETSSQQFGLAIELATPHIRPGKSGAGGYKRLRLPQNQIASLPDPADRQLIRMLEGVGRDEWSFGFGREVSNRTYLRADATEMVKAMCATGRCLLRLETKEANLRPLRWDDQGTWQLQLAAVIDAENHAYRLQGAIQRGEQRLDLDAAQLIVEGGPIFINDTAAAFDDGGAFAFVELLRQDRQISVPLEQGDELVAELLKFPSLPRLDLPPAMGLSQVLVEPRPTLHISAERKGSGPAMLRCVLQFAYGPNLIPLSDRRPATFDPQERKLVYRDLAAERQAEAKLRSTGFRQSANPQSGAIEYRLGAEQLPAAVRALTAEKWQIEVSGKAYRQPGKITMEVKSGIDWFELQGEADFEGHKVSLPALLQAAKSGEATVTLDDGTVGILPEDWLQKYGLLGGLGDLNEQGVQFAQNQAGILDALLAGMPEVNVDETFAKARQRLSDFQGVSPIDPPASFCGSLRPYQREGLGWFHFLREFGLHGCLADDMGLGKTVQVIALLEERRLLRDRDSSMGPSLVVVPRSLIFNWQQEIRRFAPAMRVLDHARADRLRATEHFSQYDVILTTYGTLRNDAIGFSSVEFDYAILDEAQAIKNAASESAKAARLIRARHRLALSGTPVQNHLGELWSLFEFLNPGMLGASSAFAGIAAARTVDAEIRRLLSQALRPFVLRRTKEQVATDLPEKFEQTILCELAPLQRKLYNELKEHYRQSLMQRIDETGLNRSKIHVLEALLRLRQAACHPGLIDKTRVDDRSAKLDTLIPRLAEVADEGHKAIVFSQFTSLLAIVRRRLDEQGTVYEYLDGKTRDRQERVERFQTDDKCKLFLVSLKAGGLGLNLTAAQYVFLLDPWWNPAIEAQAIDRAHRIGQVRNVFACRLIGKDTVEEKVLELQQSKRELADAIINADNAVISQLGREDLELLLS